MKPLRYESEVNLYLQVNLKESQRHYPSQRTHHGTKIFDLGVDVHTGNGRVKIVDLTAKEARV